MAFPSTSASASSSPSTTSASASSSPSTTSAYTSTSSSNQEFSILQGEVLDEPRSKRGGRSGVFGNKTQSARYRDIYIYIFIEISAFASMMNQQSAKTR